MRTVGTCSVAELLHSRPPRQPRLQPGSLQRSRRQTHHRHRPHRSTPRRTRRPPSLQRQHRNRLICSVLRYRLQMAAPGHQRRSSPLRYLVLLKAHISRAGSRRPSRHHDEHIRLLNQVSSTTTGRYFSSTWLTGNWKSKWIGNPLGNQHRISRVLKSQSCRVA